MASHVPAPEDTKPPRTTLLDHETVTEALSRMAERILELSGGPDGLVLMGIRRRGVELGRRIQSLIEARTERPIPFGILDITLYRDDLGEVGIRPVVGESILPLEGVEGRIVVIVDDVLFTGRTVRAALNELMDWGRPARILLAVLVDRGGREFPPSNASKS
jgi:pyrimidine operon attenuation protein/uracil phosphoribosyltransferase